MTEKRSKSVIMVVFGTRPEAIKMAPVIAALRRSKTLAPSICITAQHREMLDQVMALFNISADFDLNIMRPGQTLTDITMGVLGGMQTVFRECNPAMVLVHGDTTTTLAAAIAAFYHKIPVGHVEAGLRSGNVMSPWPEEINRKLADAITSLYFPPTERAKQNLLNEGIPPATIHVTGNTVLDALLRVAAKTRADSAMAVRFPYLDAAKKLILVTGHRRENFGNGFERICHALKELAARPDVQVVYPVHLNPNVQKPVRRLLGGLSNMFLIEPLDYLPFVYLMDRSYLIITDSGGVQEEAPSLGKPVLVMRDTTERPEALDAGTAKLVGTDPAAIVREASILLDNADEYNRMARAHNPYGDGKAAKRIVRHIEEFFA